MEQKNNVVGWFEIPVLNMERAIRFYEKIFDFKLARQKVGNLEMAWFPWVDDAIGASGSLVLNKELYKPSKDGVLIYFTAQSGDVFVELSRVKDAGGKVLVPKTLITDDIGYMAIIEDTEGNRIALHSRK
jgi:predicted enzyme related to lactoylglutathione lyase